MHEWRERAPRFVPINVGTLSRLVKQAHGKMTASRGTLRALSMLASSDTATASSVENSGTRATMRGSGEGIRTI